MASDDNVQPHQSHYQGKGDELPQSFVASDLTVFRHFGLSGPRLKPDGIRPMGYDWSPTQVHYPYDEEWVAQCQARRFVRDEKEVVQHDVPDHKCTCGFYASYSPEVDFYPGYLDFRFFAACKVSGRVIMGTKGVRAQKIKISGMWLDPETRQVDVMEMERLRDKHKNSDWFKRQGWIGYDVITAALRMKAAEANYLDKSKIRVNRQINDKAMNEAFDHAFEDYESALVQVHNTPANLPDLSGISGYGIPVYDTMEELLAKHPPEDVSELLKD